MAHTQSKSIAAIPIEAPAAVGAHAEGLFAEEMTLRDLRKSRGLTQTDLARRLHKGQELVSRIEQRQDLLLSTLRTYVTSLGGELELICRFADRAPVRIKTGGRDGLPARLEGGMATGQGVPLLIAHHQSEIAALCRRYGARRVAVFGSIVRGDFDAQSSDIDMVVEFRSDVGISPANQYFDFKVALEQLLGRPVDLVELDAMPDSRLKRIIERTQIPVYAEAA
jgi:predicted nucleotidyltransferase